MAQTRTDFSRRIAALDKLSMCIIRAALVDPAAPIASPSSGGYSSRSGSGFCRCDLPSAPPISFAK
jgi:hypothetical protein